VFEKLVAQQRLIVRPIVQVLERSAERWIVSIGPRQRELRGVSAGRLLPALFERLDGSRSVAELVGEVSRATGAPAANVETALQRLYAWEVVDDAAGYVESEESPTQRRGDRQERYFALFSSRPVANGRVVESARVLVVGTVAWARRVCASLREAGVGEVCLAPQCGAMERWSLVVGCGAPVASAEAQALNRECIAAQRPLLIGVLQADVAELGPLLLPHRSACLVCVAEHRYGDNAPPTPESSGRAADPLLGEIVAQWLALEALRFLAPALHPTLAGVVQLCDFNQQILSEIAVPKRLRCPVCGMLVGRSPLVLHPVGGDHALYS